MQTSIILNRSVSVTLSGLLHLGFGALALGGALATAEHAHVHEALVEIEMLRPEEPPAAKVEPPPPEVVPEHHTHPYPVAPDHDAHPHDPSIVHAPLAQVAPASPAVSEAAAIETAAAGDAPAHFAMSSGNAQVAFGAVGSNARPAQPAVVAAPEIVPESGVSTAARLVRGAAVEYPAAAREAEIEVDVPVEIVVDTSGAVIAARSITHSGYGLDEAALRAVRAYRFSPAQRAGAPVRVRMRWVVQFRLR